MFFAAVAHSLARASDVCAAPKVLLLFSVAALTSCVTTPKVVSVTYLSDPPRATIYDADHSVGQAPVTIKYNGSVYEHVLPGGRQCFPTRPVTARWESGAEERARFVLLCTDQGADQAFVFTRPKGVPGIDVDQAFATGDASAVAAAKRQNAIELAEQKDAREALRQREAKMASEVVEDAVAVGLAVLGVRYGSPHQPVVAAPKSQSPLVPAAIVRPAVTPQKPMTTTVCSGSVVGSGTASVVMACN